MGLSSRVLAFGRGEFCGAYTDNEVGMIKFLATPFLSLLLIGGCASKEKPLPKVHPAAQSLQDMAVDNGMPIREVSKEKQEFFYKKCVVDNRPVWPSKTSYDCNEP